MFRRNFEADEDKIMADDRSKSTNNKSIVIEIEFVEFDCSWSWMKRLDVSLSWKKTKLLSEQPNKINVCSSKY